MFHEKIYNSAPYEGKKMVLASLGKVSSYIKKKNNELFALFTKITWLWERSEKELGS